MLENVDFRAIGKRIKFARINADFTQERLANKLNLTVTHISNIERGNARLSLTTLIHIANVLSVNADDLLCDNIIHSNQAYNRQMSRIADECDEVEIRILTDVMLATLDSLRNGKKIRELSNQYLK